jgi:hypothetical protein
MSLFVLQGKLASNRLIDGRYPQTPSFWLINTTRFVPSGCVRGCHWENANISVGEWLAARYEPMWYDSGVSCRQAEFIRWTPHPATR